MVGLRRAGVFAGGGSVEMTITAETRVAEYRDGGVRLFTVTPEAVGLPRAALGDITGGDPKHNADALRLLLEGKPGPYRDIVLLNAPAAFLLAHNAQTFPPALALPPHA